MEVKIINKSNNELPKYATEGSSAVDLRAYLEKKILINSGETALIPTGLFIEIPQGYECQIRARSGLALKYGVTVLNGIGTIDSDYRGELKVILINTGKELFEVNSGDRIAQMVLSKYETINFDLVESLSNSEREEKGFGHSGTK